ncbi:MAG: HTH domain-containing protein, partial [Nitrospirae bacterium]|nr:HTH domain-containing protein [Nitrospirota bacterium]
MNPKSKRFPEQIGKLWRLLTILRMLDRCEKVTSKIYAKKFSIHERNIYRDIDDLEIAGFAIRFDDEGKTYRFADPDFSLRDLSLSEKELMALLFGRQLAHRLGKPLENGFNSLLKKAHTETGTETELRADRLQKGKQNLWVAIDPVNDFENIEGYYNTINKAIDDKLMLEITYHGMKSQSVSQRQVAPYGLFYG